jgi:nucleotide-binding universal stress UspA family protein
MVAQTFDGSVKLLQVIDAHYFPSIDAISPDTRRVLDHIERAARSQANFQLSHLTAKIGENADVSGAIVVADDVATAIESYASEGKTDLLVIAAQGEYANTAGRYGHICESLLSHMRRPILVLRSEPPDLTMSNFRSVFLNESRADIV